MSYGGLCVHLLKAKRYSKHLCFPPFFFFPFFLGTDLIENVYIASKSRKEPESPQASAVPEHRLPMNSITVSKKRSWLQQSTHRPPLPPSLEEENACKEMHRAVTPVPKSPIPLHEPAVPRAPSVSLVGRERPVGSCAPVGDTASPAVPRSPALDLGEDNDADDEGEIWYNPIPEDDEPDLLRVHPSAVNSPVAVGSLAIRYKSLSGDDSGMSVSPRDAPPCSMESTGNSHTSQPSEMSQADAAHPGEQMPQHWQRFACKAPSVPAAEDNPTFKCPSAGKRVQERKSVYVLCFLLEE